MKPNKLKLLEDLYNFLGANEKLLQSEYKKFKKAYPKDIFNFSQFCVTTYSNLNENNKPTKPSK